MNAFFIAPADLRRHAEDADRHPPLARAAPGAAGPHPGRAGPAPAVVGIWDAITGRSRVEGEQPRRALQRAECCDHAPDRRRVEPHRHRLGVLPLGGRGGVRRDARRRRRADPLRRPGAGGRGDRRRVRLHLAGRTPRTRRRDRAVHRPPRRQHQPGDPGLRLGAAVLGDPVRGPVGPTGRPGLPLQAGHVLRVRADRAVEAQTRDNLLEISVRDQLQGELPMETDLSRWFALWGAPGL